MKVSFLSSSGEVVSSPVVSVLPSHIAGYDWIEVNQGHTVKVFTTYEPNLKDRPFRVENINTVYRTDTISDVKLNCEEHHIAYDSGDEIWYSLVNDKMVVTKLITYNGIVWELGKGYSKV